jgi:hypothetical protein
MTYAMKPLGCDPQHVKGMSEKLIVCRWRNADALFARYANSA